MWAQTAYTRMDTSPEKLFKEYYPKVFRYLRSRLADREAAEDLAQEVFLKVARSMRLYDPAKSSPGTWVWRIAQNALIDHYRASARRPESAATFAEVEMDDAPGYVHGADDERLVAEILRTYSEDDRELFRMRYVAGLSYDEISDLTGRTPNALTVAAHRIREKFKKDLHDRTI